MTASVPLTANAPRVSVVIPAMNEAQNLRTVLPQLAADLHEVILVDGRSTDGTADVARSIRPDIRLVHQAGRGKGDALRAGFEASTGDIVVMLDADGSNDPAEIPRFVAALVEGADVAKGSRFLRGGGTADMELHRKLGNFVFVAMVRLLFGGRYTDLCYGYNAFWRRVLPVLDLDGDGFEIETQMNVRILREKLVVAEVPSYEARRIHGTSNLQVVRDGLRVTRTILHERLRSRRRRPAIAGADTTLAEHGTRSGLEPVPMADSLTAFRPAADSVRLVAESLAMTSDRDRTIHVLADAESLPAAHRLAEGLRGNNLASRISGPAMARDHRAESVATGDMLLILAQDGNDPDLVASAMSFRRRKVEHTAVIGPNAGRLARSVDSVLVSHGIDSVARALAQAELCELLVDKLQEQRALYPAAAAG